MRVHYRHVIEDQDRHGNVRVYYRRDGRKIRIAEQPGSPAFAARVAELAAQFDAGTPPPRPAGQALVADGTLAWLFARYHASPAFRSLDPLTQRRRYRLAQAMMAEPVRPGARETFEAFPVTRLGPAALEVLRDRKASVPGSANNRVRALRALFKWAKAQRIVTVDPARQLDKLRVVSSGWHTWTPDEIDRFEAAHGPGTKARLALRLLVYTGARRSDAARLGRQHERDGVLRWTAYKGRNRHPMTIELPILPPLREALDAGPVGEMVYLVTDSGRPFAIAGFGNWFHDRCVEAGLPHCSAHGLRKAAAARAAEAGATAHQLMAVFGWRSLSEAESYTREAVRRRMAAAGMGHLLQGMAAGLGAAQTVPPRLQRGTKPQK
jgi:integrase